MSSALVTSVAEVWRTAEAAGHLHALSSYTTPRAALALIMQSAALQLWLFLCPPPTPQPCQRWHPEVLLQLVPSPPPKLSYWLIAPEDLVLSLLRSFKSSWHIIGATVILTVIHHWIIFFNLLMKFCPVITWYFHSSALNWVMWHCVQIPRIYILNIIKWHTDIFTKVQYIVLDTADLTHLSILFLDGINGTAPLKTEVDRSCPLVKSEP